MNSQPVIRLDLTRQKLLIKPNDPLPRFHPPPKAIMITPIYDYDAQLEDPRYAYAYSATPDPRHSSTYTPSYMQYPRDSYARDPRRDEFRHRPYSPSPSPRDHRRPYRRSPSSSSSNDPHNRPVHSDDDSPHRRQRGRRASSYTPPPRHGNRRHEARTPSTERHSTYSGRHEYDRDSYPSYEEDNSHRYSAYPHSYNQSRIRERPPDDPLARHPPDFQVQASTTSQAASEHTTGSRPPALSAQSVVASHGDSAATQQRRQHGLGQLSTGASVHAGRSPFYPPTNYSTTSSQHGRMHSPAVTGVRTAPSNVSALSLRGRLMHDKQALDDFIKDYFKLLPPHPDWMPSRLTGNRKAVCIGINYVGQRKELKGCFNDAKSMREFLITQHRFPSEQILLLTDADSSFRNPTREEMIKAFMWLVKDAKPNDSLFIHYSGHGGQSEDASGREEDGMDDTIYPVDFQQQGSIIDDELYKVLVDPLPAGCRLTAIFDSCHSGTVLDLPYLHSSHGRLRGLQHVTARAKKRATGLKSDVICFAACKDDEKSADTFEGGVAVGAMSHAFLQTLERTQHLTYDDLLSQLRGILVPKYRQKPQISGTNPLDVERVFSL